MSTETATDPTVLTPELIDRVRKLAPADKARLQLLLADDGEPDGTPEEHGEPDGTPEELRQAWNEEIQRRLDAITCGEMKMYTVEETMSYLRSRSWRSEQA